MDRTPKLCSFVGLTTQQRNTLGVRSAFYPYASSSGHGIGGGCKETTFLSPAMNEVDEPSLLGERLPMRVGCG
jgi:hypothetical protein